MKPTIRRMRIPEDYPVVAKLLNHLLSDPVTAAELRDEDSKIPEKGRLTLDEDGLLAGHDRYRIVCENERGEAVGYGISWRAPWTTHGELNHSLVVDPQYRGMGAGKALYDALEAWAVDCGASVLNYEIRDSETSSLRFAVRRGFQVERHLFESVLSLPDFDEAHLSEAMARAEAEGIRFTSLQELAWENAEQKLYELYRSTNPDIPGSAGDFPPFEEWRKWSLELPGAIPDGFLLALDGQEIIGVAHVLYRQPGDVMYNEYTAVAKPYRGRRIALALKLLAIRRGKQLQAKVMRTNNDSLNRPMLSINRLLGFEPAPGMYKVVKHMNRR